MPRPTQKEMRTAVLEILKDGKVHKYTDIVATIAQRHFTEEDPEEEIERLYFQLSTATSKLKKNQLIINPSKGNWKLTDMGNNPIAVQKAEEVPEDLFKDKVERTNQMLEQELKAILLSKVQEMDDVLFEMLCGTLLQKMNYGKFEGTSQTRDGGVDGFLNQDELGLNRICFQAKCYGKDSIVNLKEIKEFKTSIDDHKCQGGIFITSNNYTKDALTKAKQLHIIAIDGKRLVDLMVKYNLGVKAVERQELDFNPDDFRIV